MSGVLVVAAVERELRPLVRLLAASPIDHCRLVCCGVGKLSAALVTDEHLRAEPPSRLLHVGCAGGFPPEVGVGDVVIATEEVLADEGVETPVGFLSVRELGFPIARLPRPAAGEIEDDETSTLWERVPTRRPTTVEDRAIGAAVGDRFRVLHGRVVTVSCASGTERRASELRARCDPLAETLEGAAVGVAAWRRRVPFHEVRGISNHVGDRERERWRIDEACEHAAVVAHAWLEVWAREGAET